MKIKYDTQTGEIICMGDMPQLDGAVEVDFDIPSEPLNYFTFDGAKLVRKEQGEIDRIQNEANFSFHALMGRLNQTMAPMSIFKLAPYTGALQSFCDWKNWAGIGAFLNSLIDAEIATVEEISQVVDAFEEQGISL